MSGQIHNSEFILLKGVVPIIRQTVEVLEEPGVDYQRRRLVGLRSPEFTLESMVDVADREAAMTELAVYRGLIDDAPVVLQKDGFNYNTGPPVGMRSLVAVLDVQPVQSDRSAIICADKINSGNWMLTARWRLRLVANG
jgi:hypothetical protein